MTWPGAAVVILCEAIACWACWCDPAATAPGGPGMLLFVTTSWAFAWPIFLYREDRRRMTQKM